LANAAPYLAVVDDDASVRVALGRLLRIAGYDVTTFESGAELLELLDRVPACLLLDVHVPGLTGFEVQARLRAQGIDPPVVFITASDDVALAAKAREAGGVRLLRKPFSNDALLEAVAAALRL
jgi:FixJ family two-component response regulator